MAAFDARGGQHPTLMVVEDFEDFRVVLADYLSSEGFNVLTAVDGEQALEHLESTERLDFVLLDLVLPRMGGELVLARIGQGRWRNVPVVAMTSYEKPRPPGAVEMLWKPFNLDTLLTLIARYTGRAVPPPRAMHG